jgi:hypothetical protein
LISGDHPEIIQGISNLIDPVILQIHGLFL